MTWNQHWLAGLLLSVVLFNGTQAKAQPLEDVPVVQLNQGQLQVLRDSTRQLGLDDIRAAQAAGDFRALPGNLGLGYIADAVWLHWRVEQPTGRSSERWLEVMPPYLDDIRLFHIGPDGQIDARHGGDRLPQSAKEEDYRGTVFKVQLSPGRHKFYLRLQSTSTMAAIVKLWQPTAFAHHLRGSYFGFGIYFSLIFTVLLFNAANWVVSRRRIFLVYVGYLLLNALQWLGINGFVAEFLFPAQPLLANLTLGISLSLAAAMAFGFFIMVLELKRHHPRLYRINAAGMGLCLVTAVATPLGHYGLFTPWMLGFGALTLVTIPWPIGRLWATRDLWARLLAAAYATYGVLISINIMGVLAVLPFGEGINIAGMSSNIAHILLLHFAILLHYRRVEAAHAEALEASATAMRQAALEKTHSDDQDKLLAMITHEIRTPIAVIDAATQTLEALDHTPSNDRTVRYERIRRSIDRLSVLLDLTTAQTQSDVTHWALTQGVFNPVVMTNEVLDLLGDQHAQRIRLDLAPNLPLLSGDDRMLRFALLNLLDNACKYSPPDLPVAVHVSASHQGVTWRVTDQGPGIPAGMEERIFEKYVRASEKGGKAGLGLGLYLARHIVERHGGRLSVEATQKQGACFVCWLPASNGENAH